MATVYDGTVQGVPREPAASSGDRSNPVFDVIKPMKAVSDVMPTGDEWVFELKWDGMRILAHTDGDRLQLRSSNGIDATSRFPELADLPEAVGNRSAVLDGEVVAFADGLPSFSALQRRMHLTSSVDIARGMVDVPVSFVIFDLLYFDGTDATSLPYEQRRQLLEQLVDPGPTWRVTDVHDDGPALLEMVTANHLEGLVAKRCDSKYHAGRRAPQWRKVKVRRHQEFVVGGWSPRKTSQTAKHSQSSTIGSLFVGYYDDGEFRYAGRVGSGLSQAEIDRLMGIFEPLVVDACPFAEKPDEPEARTATWLAPEIVAEVAFADWSPTGRLRQPSYLGQRIDTEPATINREHQ